ncbi:hypothetical protein BH09BAC1_BH09BAC1_25490 [soil metagenome]
MVHKVGRNAYTKNDVNPNFWNIGFVALSIKWFSQSIVAISNRCKRACSGELKFSNSHSKESFYIFFNQR